MPRTQAFTSLVFGFCCALCLCLSQSHGPRHCLQWRGINGNFSLSVELFAENIGEITDFQGNVTDLNGYNTYRIYLNTEGPLDKLSAVYGDDSRPLSISSTQPFRQTPLFAGASNALVNVNSPVLADVSGN